MNRARFRLTRGFSTVLSAALFATSCNYGFQGGGGFPSDIRTIYIEPFQNETVQVELDQLLFQRLTDRLPRALGARPGGEENADAVVRGKILNYDNVGQNYVPGQPNPSSNAAVDVLTYQVTITVSVQIIDRKRNVILWESNSLVGRGEYRRDTQQDTDGREIALNHILQQIIDGAQSQW